MWQGWQNIWERMYGKMRVSWRIMVSWVDHEQLKYGSRDLYFKIPKAIIIPYIFLLYKRNKTIWMFYRKFGDEGTNQMDNPNIYYVEGEHRLSPGVQHLTTGSVLFSIRFRNLYRKLLCCPLITFKYQTS